MPFTAFKVKVLPYCLLTTFALKMNNVLIWLVLQFHYLLVSTLRVFADKSHLPSKLPVSSPAC